MHPSRAAEERSCPGPTGDRYSSAVAQGLYDAHASAGTKEHPLGLKREDIPIKGDRPGTSPKPILMQLSRGDCPAQLNDIRKCD